MRKKFWNFEHLIRSGQRWFPPNIRIFGRLRPILAQSNGPFKVRKFNIPFGMYLVHTITTYRLKILPIYNTYHHGMYQVPTRYIPCTYNVCELSTGPYVSDLPIYVYVCFGYLCLETLISCDQNWQHRGENVGEAVMHKKSKEVD